MAVSPKEAVSPREAVSAREAVSPEETGGGIGRPRQRGRRAQPQMLPGRRRGDTSTRRAHEQAALDEERLVYILHRLGRLTHGDGEGRQPDGTTDEAAADRPEDRPVDLVEPELVDAEQRKTGVGRRFVEHPAAPDLGVVAHPAQQPVGDAGRAACPPPDLRGTGPLERHPQDARRPHDDRLEVRSRVVVEARDVAEAITQRAGDEARPGGGADQREGRQVEAQRAGGGTPAQHDVELVALYRRVGDPLRRGPSRWISSMNSTSPSSSLVSTAATSPARSKAGPEVTC